jgi:hypothetical protein
MIPARIPEIPDPRDAVAVGNAVRAVANQQDGVVTRSQLRGLGMTPAMVDRALLDGRLRVLHRGVYAVGHDRLAPRARWVAALLAVGPDAVLSHGAAAAARGLLPTRGGPIEITCPRRVRPRSGLVIHTSVLPSWASTVVDGLPCTSLPRTLVDLASGEHEDAARRAWGVAASRRQLVLHQVERELAARRGRPGAPTVQRLLLEHSSTLVQRTRSELERVALRLVAAAGLPTPIANALLWIAEGPYEVDLLWPSERLAVEVDPWSTHGNELSHRDDRRRDIELQLAGWRPARLTAADLACPAETGERLRRLLELPPLPAPAGGAVAPFTERGLDEVAPTGAKARLPTSM